MNWSLKKEKSYDSRPAKLGSFLGQLFTALPLKMPQATSAASMSLMVLGRSSLEAKVSSSRVLSSRVSMKDTSLRRCLQ